ncbi:hypothetical protein J2W32_004287 [Variovorax boronicumulans]|uniref:Uncharacterized protein n=1 Tax=Variovorax boronicumulans TaxID=436515 RepID=A0AAW8CWA3_9BURK|nr:hypothetical protein [Variovorax boronicumulans]MDP9892144.1 hypothetical protein [Variovorax boronicumulans]MDQ0055229.1 hypothetical protein [Variovorax boronicumulans]
MQESGWQPIAGRVGHVGGIESFTLDGRRYYFGFDHKQGLVLSPAIDDAAAMAHFASRHMQALYRGRLFGLLGKTGPRDEAFWAEAVEWSENATDLPGQPERTLASAQLAASVSELGLAAQENRIAREFMPDALPCMLLAAAGDGSPDEAEGIQAEVAIVWGREPLPPGREIADIARTLQARLDALVDRAQGNWAQIFSMLKS